MGKCVFSEFGLAPPSPCRILHNPIGNKSVFSFPNPKLAEQFGIFGIGFEIAVNLPHTFKDQHTHTQRSFLSEKLNYKKIFILINSISIMGKLLV